MKKFVISHIISILLASIVLLASVIRFYQLATTPPSIYWDEAAIGYNAYSIAQTGRDEFGTKFPLLFRSFDEYKSPGYIYLTVLPVMIFGLNEFSVRFSSAFLGTATILLSYFLVIFLFDLLRNEKKGFSHFVFSHRNSIGLLTAFLLAISPWHIEFSRAGFEANVGLFLILLGTCLLIKNIREANISFIFATVCFALSFYFYRSLYIFTPLFLLINIAIFHAEIKKQIKNKYAWIGVVVFFIIFTPFIPSMFSKEGMVRSQVTSVNNVVQEDLNQAAILRQKLGDPLWARVIYDRRIVYVERVIQDYMIHFSPKFLFIEGDTNARHRTINFGEMYLWEAPFLLVGLYLLFSLHRKLKVFILSWILIAPLAASFTIPVPHALRTLNILPMPQVLVAMGIVFLFYHIKKITFRYSYVGFLTLLVIIFFIKFITDYSYTTNLVSKEWGDGYKQLTTYVFQHEHAYDKIIVSGHYWQPYIYFLFYKKYDPVLYQCVGTKKHFAKYIFGGTSWDQGTELDNIDLLSFAKTTKALVALSPKEYNMQRSHIKQLTTIYDHAHVPIFIVGELNK